MCYYKRYAAKLLSLYSNIEKHLCFFNGFIIKAPSLPCAAIKKCLSKPSLKIPVRQIS